MFTSKETETIHTEICEKIQQGKCRENGAGKAGLEIKRWFTDSRGWFSLVELGPNIIKTSVIFLHQDRFLNLLLWRETLS